MRKFFVAAAFLAATAVPALAADMAVKYTKAPAVAQVYDWSGFYIGAGLGGQWSDIGLSSTFAPLAYSFRHDSFTGGGHAGYQQQFGQFVVGVEGAYMAAIGDSGQLVTPAIGIFFPGGTGKATTKLKDIWSIGGRVGWAPSNWMLYGTGGYASGSFAFDAACCGGNTEHASARPDGFYIGAGVEYAVAQNWILGVEYRHYAFDAKTVASTSNIGFTEPVRFDTKTDVVMGRISYKFNWAGPVVAKY